VVGAARIERNVSYGPSDLDIFPTNQRCGAPVLMFVHGGGWCCGNKGAVGDQVIRWANDHGYAFVSIEYRLGQRYPVFDQDVAEAIAWVRSHASEFGGDGNKLALMGHSTGGSMVAELGTTPSLYTSQVVFEALDCVVVLDASVLDIAGKMASGPSEGSAASIRRYYGADAQAWTTAAAWDNAQRSNNVGKFLIATRANQSAEQTRFGERLRERGSVVQFVNANGISHGQVLNNIGSVGDRVMTGPVQSFLNDCLG
jgi:arylformamidase